ncbi:hypothetical protein GCM10010363_59020 [Streptomyces omiyaensis]|nr:hypothetical protein GCM10010363_59020 [Streptomyces omiyaensis]
MASVAVAGLAGGGGSGQGQVADLARTAEVAPVQASVEDEGRAQALVRPEQDEVRAVGRRVRPLGDRREVDVVLDPDREPELLAEHALHVGEEPGRHVLLARVPEPAGRRVHRALDADHHPLRRLRRRNPAEGGAQRHEQGVPAGPGRRGRLRLAEHGAADVRGPHRDPLRRHVDGHRVGGRRIEPVRLRDAPGEPGAQAVADDQARVLQAGEDLGGGGLGEAGETADLGSGEGALTEQQVEGGAVVDRAHESGCAADELGQLPSAHGSATIRTPSLQRVSGPMEGVRRSGRRPDRWPVRRTPGPVACPPAERSVVRV